MFPNAIKHAYAVRWASEFQATTEAAKMCFHLGLQDGVSWDTSETGML